MNGGDGQVNDKAVPLLERHHNFAKLIMTIVM